MLQLSCLHNKTDVIRMLANDSRVDLQAVEEVQQHKYYAHLHQILPIMNYSHINMKMHENREG